MRVLVTGANGFIGSALCVKLLHDGYEVIAAQRKTGSSSLVANILQHNIDSIASDANWMPVLADVEAVVHLAGRAHIMNDKHPDPITAYREINVDGTLNLARQAVSAGVRRFVFISSVKVCGEGQLKPEDGAYTEAHPPLPSDPYAISKWEAEQGLRLIAMSTGLEVVILRPPLVYGPGVGANFLRFMGLVHQGWPLPFGSIVNQRSLIYIGNLVDAISASIHNPAAAHKTFLLSDGEFVSTPDLIRCVARALGVPARLVPVPKHWLLLLGTLSGKSQVVNRLLGSLILDNSKIHRDLTWVPPFTMRQGMEETVRWYQSK